MRITGKKARAYVNQYNRTPKGLRLGHIYKSYSEAKERVWIYCEDMCDRLNGRGLTILSATCQCFTAAFEYKHPDTGVRMLHVETVSNSYDMEM